MINLNPAAVFEEYKNGVNHKNSLGTKGIYEQAKINGRFYRGDQWYGADCGNQRPLVRHNIIKRIGEYKLCQIVGTPLTVSYGVNGISKTKGKSEATLKKRMAGYKFSSTLASDEINSISEAMDKYFLVTSKRLGLETLYSKVLKNAYITGTGILYTYWDKKENTAIGKNNSTISGDIRCEVLDVQNVYFGNPFVSEIEDQPYIIIASVKDTDDVLEEAAQCGADEFTLRKIKSSAKSTLVLTKLFKMKDSKGNETVMCAKFTENATIKSAFDTNLRRYPIALFRWEDRNGSIYGDSEITYLIPNQIAINRMITANVWSAVTMGMPLMIVNGDTVNGDITNDPGQIIKVFGTNEDVAGAVKYITPPDTTSNFGNSVNMLIENTLAQCGANEVALGDSRADNMSALNLMRNAATMPLNLIKDNFRAFAESVALIWIDFWVTQYGKRKLKISDESGIWYMPFNSERYKDLSFSCYAQAETKPQFTPKETVDLLTDLLQKGVITRDEYFERLPEGLIPNRERLTGKYTAMKGENDDGV